MTSKILSPRILLITKDKKILQIFQNCLQSQYFDVRFIEDLTLGIKLALSNKYNLLLIVADLKNPQSVYQIKRFRSKNKLFPILIIGPNNIESQTEAYNLGVNIYHSQPIICTLLKAQIGQLTRFFNERIFFEEDNIIIDVGTRMINIDGKSAIFTNREFLFLILLIKAEGHVVSKETISSHLSNYSKDDATNVAIETLVSRVRAKIRNCKNIPFIETIHDAGYRINPKYLKSFGFTRYNH